MSIITRTCQRCKVEQPLSGFYIEAEARSGARKGSKKPALRPCRVCNREMMQEISAPKRKMIRDRKMGTGCMDCGLFPDVPEVLEFDHRPDEKKSFGLAQIMGKSLDQIEAEMNKCDVVCANCHRVRTVLRKKTAAGKTYSRDSQRVKDHAAGNGHVWDAAELPVHYPKVAPGQEALFAA